MIKFRFSAILCACLFYVITTSSNAEQKLVFNTKDLGVLPTGSSPSSYRGAVNFSGQVAGSIGSDAVVAQAGGGITYIPYQGQFARANAINEVGEVVGIDERLYGTGNRPTAFYWSIDTGTVLLGISASNELSEAWSITDTGLIGGHADNSSGAVWAPNGTGFDRYSIDARINDISDSGLVTGTILRDDGLSGSQPYVWSFSDANPNPSQITRIDALGFWHPFAINNQGQMTGHVGGSPEYGFISDFNSTSQFMGFSGFVSPYGPEALSNIFGTSINSIGQVAGQWEENGAGRGTHTIYWDAINGVTDLGTLGGTYSKAFSINEAGEIIGLSTDLKGDLRVALWTPVVVPIPPTVWLFVSGLISIVWVSGYKKVV